MEETIAAIATPPGEGGIGIVRMSGEKAFDILDKLFVPGGDAGKEGRALRYGHIVEPGSGEKVDEVLAVRMRAPKTYTGEDVCEIDCHGGIVPLRRILELCLDEGARLAERGEFTKRAFLNGRIDLSQAEAVMDIVKARSDKSFDVAKEQLEGSVSRKIRDIRNGIMDILVELTVNIDYPDEDIEVITYEKLEAGIAAALTDVKKLVDSAGEGRILREGLKVAIIGRPNVGKSSLMNALLRESRAIVTDIPGTTRDTIEESISVKGIPVVLTDTAGIRDTSDKVEEIGVERSKESFNRADLVVFMLDGSEPLDGADREIAGHIDPEKTIVLLNKSDLERKTGPDDVKELLGDVTLIETSLKDGGGTLELENEIERRVNSGETGQDESVVISNERQLRLLRSAEGSLNDAMRATKEKEPVELIEIDVNSAYRDLGEVIGEEASDDVLEEVFSRFCLGK